MINKNTNNNNVTQYKNIELNTATPLKLVVMLYDAAINNIKIAIDKMNFKTYDIVNEKLQKSNEIIAELKISLNMKAGGEISKNLNDIYIYLNTKINQGNIDKKIEPLEESIRILKELRQSWNELSQKNNSSKIQKTQITTGGLNIKG